MAAAPAGGEGGSAFYARALIGRVPAFGIRANRRLDGFMTSRKRLLALSGYTVLGPITGPLVAGIIRNLGKGELLLACLYALALPVAWYELAAVATWAAAVLPR